MKKLNNLILIMTCSMLLASQINAVTPGSICLATQDKAALGSKINVGSLLTSIKTHGKSFLSGKTFLYSAIAACAIGFLGFMGYKSWQNWQKKKKEDERLKREKATKDLLAAMNSEQKDNLLNSIKNAIDNGANVNAKDYDGLTPFHTACQKCNKEIVGLLLDRDANVNAVDDYGFTPLYIACCSGQIDTARLLLENGADVNLVNKLGLTPLHTACRDGHIDTARLLLENGADIKAKDIYGMTPLHAACYNGYIDVVKLLIESGAYIEAKDNDGKTAFDLAKYKPQILELLHNARAYNELNNNEAKINFIKDKKDVLNGLNKSDEAGQKIFENQEGAFSSLLKLALNKAKKAEEKELADSIEDIGKEYLGKDKDNKDLNKETN